VPKKTRAHYTADGHRRGDPDVTRIAREDFTRSRRRGQERGRPPEPPVAEEAQALVPEEVPEAIRSGREIPVIPRAMPTPHHYDPTLHKPRVIQGAKRNGGDRRAARRHEPRPPRPHLEPELPPEAVPTWSPARRGLPFALLSGVMTVPVAALRLAGHFASRATAAVARLAALYRTRGERLVDDWRERRLARK
jgi:hypothetical protein